ncbi:MAG: hypothetical protein CFE21_06235 [Bacteroidetes bacterium B1(2017)]|nr:MAG: hypothetical protein CFE21_06235 [Bacteroidetes bacterium B1(2017)]
MRPIEELINKEQPGGVLIREWISKGKNKVEILEVDSLKGRDELYKLQITTRSPMGAMAYTTGGILIDNGWIRILGSGNPKLTRTITSWNKGKAFDEIGNPAKFLLIADDAIGGFFVLNFGAYGTDFAKVYYFSPDNLNFEPLDLTYSEFLNFCFNGDLDDFYKNLRWKNWQDEVKNLQGDWVYTFYPTLWSKEGKDITKNVRNPVPIEEQYSLNIEFRKQLGLDTK